MFSMKAPSKAEAIVSASCRAVCFLEQVNDALFEFILEWLEVVHSLLVLFRVLCSELPCAGNSASMKLLPFERTQPTSGKLLNRIVAFK